MNFNDIKKLDDNNFLNVYARFPVAIKEGKNDVCTDINNKKYIDFTSGIGVNSLGFCDENWAKAVSNQAFSLNHASNLFYTMPSINLSKKLCDLTKLDKVFLCNSGAEANEIAIKAARKYGKDKYGEKRCNIITLKNSFHGRTITTLAATGQDSFHDKFKPLTEGFLYCEANNIKMLEKTADDTVCGIMIEIIQGEGGVNTLDKDFVKYIQKLCLEKDIILIVDEVQTGISRTGKLFSYMNMDISPDIVSMAKGLGGGLPIGGALFSEKVSKVFSYGDHGSTFGGNPIACAGALEVLKRVCEPDFQKDIIKKSDYIKDKLKDVDEIKSVTGMGLMLGIKLKTKNNKEIISKCIENGLLLLSAKDKIRLLPPLTITFENLEKGINILISTLKGE